MAKLTRYVQTVFGSTAGTNEMAEFGSLAAGSPQRYNGTTITPSIVQTLSNYLSGWFSAVEGAYSPAIEDMNALCFLFAYQLTYLFQEGVAEWEATTIYYQESVTNYAGNIYVSLTDNNTNNLPTDETEWKLLNSGVKTKTSDYTVLASDNIILADATGGSFNVTLPAAAGLSGKRVSIKQIDNSGNPITVLPTGGDLLDLETEQLYTTPLTAVDWVSDGVSNWYAF